MRKKEYLKISLIVFIVCVVFMVINYFVYHYLGTDLKFHSEFHATPEKPFVTEMIGDLSMVLLAISILFLVIGIVKKDEK